jgi:DNA-directed RNA polymerase specialized sigma24 family protein
LPDRPDDPALPEEPEDQEDPLSSHEAFEQAQNEPTAGAVAKIERVHADLIRVASRRIPRALHSAIDPEQAVQDVWTILSRKGIAVLDKPGPGALSAWLRKALDDQCTDLLRRHYTQKRGGGRPTLSIGATETGSPSIDTPGDDPTPSQCACSAEVIERTKALLPPAEYDVWHATVLEGEDDVVVAKRIGRTSSAVRGLRARALQRLRDGLGTQ